MKRKNIRLRREYLYNKENEKRKQLDYQKKLQVKQAMSLNKPIPTELYKEEGNIRN